MGRSKDDVRPGWRAKPRLVEACVLLAVALPAARADATWRAWKVDRELRILAERDANEVAFGGRRAGMERKGGWWG
jgi:hypothetical protein